MYLYKIWCTAPSKKRLDGKSAIVWGKVFGKIGCGEVIKKYNLNFFQFKINPTVRLSRNYFNLALLRPFWQTHNM
jgi:hypothetical protein